ncbi:hypothetical protein BB561_003836 [Smittium simulii]|nr:hypothetical protein BB561_003836 [Smittium simulii]
MPRIMYYVPVILMFEFSTIFLNNIWFCDKLGLAGSQLQIANSIGLLISFAVVRVFYGSYKFYELAVTIISNWNSFSNFLIYTIFPSIIILWSLNLFWFYKITRAFFKKFAELKSAKSSQKSD